MPQFWIAAGPNGAGKSTLVSRRLVDRLTVIDPDRIAAGLPRLADGRLDEVEAGRRAVALRTRCLDERLSFLIETTMSGAGPLRVMERARAAGFKVTLVYVGVDDVELSRSRVGDRVAAGGHDIPVAAILRRYPDTMGKLATALEMVDRAYVIDNSERHRRLLLNREGDRVTYVAADLPAWALQAIPEAMRRRAGRA